MIILQLIGVRHRGKQTFNTLTIVKIQCDQWLLMLCGKVIAVASDAFSFGYIQNLSDVAFFYCQMSVMQSETVHKKGLVSIYFPPHISDSHKIPKLANILFAKKFHFLV